jgi:methylisocitrate lyase
MKKPLEETWRSALENERPLQIIGVPNAYVASMATRVGYQALYLSGAAVANFCYCLPDLGMTSLDNVLTEARRITNITSVPLLVDIDTGWGGRLNIQNTIKEMERAGVAAVHIEDQIFEKRCGHREGKELVSTNEMVDRIKAAVDARTDEEFVIMARTDAHNIEGIEKATERAIAYREAGADMIFAESFESLEEYRYLKQAVNIPILANMTEFGKTPLYTIKELAEVGVDMILYPLSIARTMNAAALGMLCEIRSKGTQKEALDLMQSRNELYQFLDYERYESEI